MAELIAELERAGLVSAQVDADGEFSFALTLQGQLVARQMAMSRNDHALILLGALMGAGDYPN